MFYEKQIMKNSNLQGVTGTFYNRYNKGVYSRMKITEIIQFLTNSIFEKYEIDIRENINQPILKERKKFKARDIINLVYCACLHFNIDIYKLTSFNQPVTILGIAQYLLDNYKFQNVSNT